LRHLVEVVVRLKWYLKTKMSKKRYIGLIHEERNDDFTIGYNISTNINRMLKWKEETLKGCNIEDCKIFELKEINQNKDKL
jgi:hypothetical protein